MLTRPPPPGEAFSAACWPSPETAAAKEEGVSLARQLALTTYRTAEEFDLRFDGPAPAGAGAAYPVCDYLIARGEAYEASADRWITLSDSLDRHAVKPEPCAVP